MSVTFRTAAITTAIAVAVAGCLATPAFFPQAFADEPASYALTTLDRLFPAPFDPKRLRKFTITADDSVSSEVQRTQIVSKISFGQKTLVSIVTTPSGTYSSDALTSPNVRYPGIDVTPDKSARTYVDFGSVTTPRGTGSWTTISRGSFTYHNFTFSPTRRR